MRLLETTCAISVVCLCLSLRAVQQPLPPEPKPKPPSVTKPVNPLIEDMQGAWKLVKMLSLNLDVAGRTEVGFLLVSGNYFSFELHMGWTSRDRNAARVTYTSGTHRFELDEKSKMISSSVIGSLNDPNGVVVFEQPGKQREYTVECVGNLLKLRRDDGTSFEFERLLDNRPRRDFYGRPIKPKETPDDTEKGGDKGGTEKGGTETPPKKD
jgi:hypothetical protein